MPLRCCQCFHCYEGKSTFKCRCDSTDDGETITMNRMQMIKQANNEAKSLLRRLDYVMTLKDKLETNNSHNYKSKYCKACCSKTEPAKVTVNVRKNSGGILKTCCTGTQKANSSCTCGNSCKSDNSCKCKSSCKCGSSCCSDKVLEKSEKYNYRSDDSCRNSYNYRSQSVRVTNKEVDHQQLIESAKSCLICDQCNTRECFQSAYPCQYWNQVETLITTNQN